MTELTVSLCFGFYLTPSTFPHTNQGNLVSPALVLLFSIDYKMQNHGTVENVFFCILPALEQTLWLDFGCSPCKISIHGEILS